jgi:hypothetical protein
VQKETQHKLNLAQRTTSRRNCRSFTLHGTCCIAIQGGTCATRHCYSACHLQLPTPRQAVHAPPAPCPPQLQLPHTHAHLPSPLPLLTSAVLRARWP